MMRTIFFALLALALPAFAKTPKPPARSSKPATRALPKSPSSAPFSISGAPGSPLDTRVWFHAKAKGKAVPLVIYLHGLIGDAKIGPAQMLATPSEMAAEMAGAWPWAMNVAALAEKLIDDGKVRPLAIAAPSDGVTERKASATMWKAFPLSAFVSKVKGELLARGVKIDMKQIAVVGWSGAGVSTSSGLPEIAAAGAEIVATTPIPLALLGCADTGVTVSGKPRTVSAAIDAGLSKAGNIKTVVYSIHKMDGGASTAFDASGAHARDYADALGAKTDRLGGPLDSAAETADASAFDVYRDNSAKKSPPTRIAARVKLADLRRHAADFLSSGALYEPAGKMNPHGMVPLVWTWYALQRFFP